MLIQRGLGCREWNARGNAAELGRDRDKGKEREEPGGWASRQLEGKKGWGGEERKASFVFFWGVFFFYKRNFSREECGRARLECGRFLIGV